MTWLELLAQCAWRGTLVLAAAFAAAAGLRRASAAVRHFVWTAALTGLVLLPAAMLVAPKWSWRMAPPETARAAVVTVTRHAAKDAAGKTRIGRSATGAAAPTDVDWLLILWMLGCSAAAARFLVGAARASRMAPRAAEARHAGAMLEDLRRALGIRRPIRALESAAAPMPLTWGILRPVVLLPEAARQWPPARLRTVLLHELVHVQRFDLVAQAIAQAACCLYWFHPLAWLAARQLRRERERACDDAVLSRGVGAPEYAGHLMDLVRSLAAARTRWEDAPAMAEASDLELRVRALLDGARSRRPLSRRAALAIASVAAAVLLPVAVITAQAQATRGSVVGVVEDPSSAQVPNCQVTAKNLDGPNQEVTRANAAGEYRFAALPPGHYALEFRSAGFAIFKAEVTVEAGKAARVDAALSIGQVSETVVVKGQKPAAATAAAPTVGIPQRIRVGGNVQAAKLLRMAKPEYPAELQQLGIEGAVVMRAVISKTGEPLNLEAISTEVDNRLVKAALDVVRQWKYQPTLLNGQPVEVLTTITVDFQLGQ
ncbi:MAG: M56 family metallopeptidase [Bryobacteraceae bacterium]|jgi:TonB family protein